MPAGSRPRIDVSDLDWVTEINSSMLWMMITAATMLSVV